MIGVQQSLTRQQRGLMSGRKALPCPICENGPNKRNVLKQPHLFSRMCAPHQAMMTAKIADNDYEPWRAKGYLVWDEFGRLMFSMELAKRYRRQTAPRYGRGWRW